MNDRHASHVGEARAQRFPGPDLEQAPNQPHQPIEVTGEHVLISLDKGSQGSHFSRYDLLKELLIA